MICDRMVAKIRNQC